MPSPLLDLLIRYSACASTAVIKVRIKTGEVIGIDKTSPQESYAPQTEGMWQYWESIPMATMKFDKYSNHRIETASLGNLNDMRKAGNSNAGTSP
jgi:hypothetical protein